MHTAAHLKALLLAEFSNPGFFFKQSRLLDSLRHQQHSLCLDLWKFREILDNLLSVTGLVNDEFQLIGIPGDQIANHLGLVTTGFVPCLPGARAKL